MIYFDDQSSADFGVYVEYFPSLVVPAQKYEKVSVPGKNGDLIFPQEAYENVEREYEIYISAKERKLHNVARAVSQWLIKPGYKRLEDTYEPDVFRMAHCAGGIEIENYFNEFGKATIVFDCMPQKWLKSGEKSVQITNGATLTNPTEFPSKPLVKVTGSGNGTLTFNGTTVSLTGISGYLMIDSENMNCYKETANCNNQMSGKFPMLSGTTEISWSGNITRVDITPRWYSI